MLRETDDQQGRGHLRFHNTMAGSRAKVPAGDAAGALIANLPRPAAC